VGHIFITPVAFFWRRYNLNS